MPRVISLLTELTRRARETSFWALVDQGLISLGTFVVGILLARNLVPEQYGVFALILGILFFLNAVHNGLITYPLSVKGSTLSAEDLGTFSGAKVIWTLMLSVPLAAVMAVAVHAVGEPSYIAATIFALFAWQFHETARRALMAHLRHRELLPGDGVKFGGWAAGIFLLVLTDNVSIETIFVTLGSLSLIAGLLQCWQAEVRFAPDMDLYATGLEAWRLGKLILIGGILTFSIVPFFSWTLMFFHGPEFSARLQSLVLVLGVTHPILYSINNILVPAVSSAEQTQGREAAWRAWLSFGGSGALLVLPYFLLLFVTPSVVLNIFFGASSPYTALAQELRVWALTYMLLYSSQMLLGLFGGLRLVSAGFASQLAASATMILIGVPLVAQFDVMGACIAAAITFGVQLAIQVAYLRLPHRLPWSDPLPLQGRPPSI